MDIKNVGTNVPTINYTVKISYRVFGEDGDDIVTETIPVRAISYKDAEDGVIELLSPDIGDLNNILFISVEEDDDEQP